MASGPMITPAGSWVLAILLAGTVVGVSIYVITPQERPAATALQGSDSATPAGDAAAPRPTPLTDATVEVSASAETASAPVKSEDPKLAEPEAEPVTEPQAEPVAEPMAEPVPESVAVPVAEPVSEPAAEPVAETPVAEKAAEPVPEPVSEPTPEPVAETVSEPVSGPVPEVTPEAVAAPVIEPVPEPVAEPIAEPLEPPVAEPIAEPMPEDVAEPVPEPAPQTAPEPVAEPEAEPVLEIQPPVFDTVRVEPDGAALVAGRAAPGAKVEMLVEGETLAQTSADASGNFVALFDLPADGKGRLLSLRMTLDKGETLVSAETVAIAPVAPPVSEDQVATAEAPPAAESAAPETLLVSPDGVRVGDTTTPPIPVTIDSFGFDDSGAAQLSGRAEPGTSIRLYLNNVEQTLTQTDDQGRWQVALAQVAPGTYDLRADQIGADGAVLARVEQTVIREALVEEPPPEPVMTAPEVDTKPSAVTITVKPGYSLWRIANEELGDGILYVKVFEANKDQIRDPDLIYPGQVFTLPLP